MNSNSKLESSDTLICWIGDTDLLVFGKTGKEKGIDHPFYLSARKVWEQDKKGSPHASTFDDEITKLDLQTRNSSIIIALKDKAKLPTFSKIMLLTNRPQNNQKLLDEFCDLFASYICTKLPFWAGKVFVRFVPAQPKSLRGVDGWNYQAVYEATKRILKHEIESGDDPNYYWYNITPGTIAQSTTLIFLGKELSPESNFIQVEKSRNRVDHCEIPFDMSAAFGKGLTRLETSKEIIGRAPCFVKALDMAKRIAWAPVDILLTGPSGTGKEVLANEIHQLSDRKGDFVAINCAMLAKGTGIAELTGYFRGHHTDGRETTPGILEAAKNGTLFLDEIGDCPIDVQAELLRFLQPPNKEKPTERQWKLQGAEPTNLTDKEKRYHGMQRGNIRVIAATNKDLRDTNNFRQDLFFRLETIQIRLPSLEERKAETDESKGIDDLKELADFFLDQCHKAFQIPLDAKRQFSDEAYDALRAHKWVGNVRELQNVITRLVLLSAKATITREDILKNLNPEPTNEPTSTNIGLSEIASALARSDIDSNRDKKQQEPASLDIFNKRIDEFKRAYCSAALDATHGNKKKAYSILNINPKTFEKLIGRT